VGGWGSADDTVVANANPEFVFEALGMEEAGVVSPFVLVLDHNAVGVIRWLGFAGSFGSDLVDGTLGGFGIFHFGDSKRQSENEQRGEHEKTEKVLGHSAYLQKKIQSAKAYWSPDGVMIVRIATGGRRIGDAGDESDKMTC
jgi:hypothetical protein